jgi:adenylate cyclase
MKSTIREVSKFVPKALVKDILESEKTRSRLAVTPARQPVFTDVKDFLRIAEGIPAKISYGESFRIL